MSNINVNFISRMIQFRLNHVGIQIQMSDPFFFVGIARSKYFFPKQLAAVRVPHRFFSRVLDTWVSHRLAARSPPYRMGASRLVTNEMDPGPHLIYYPVGKNLRYYAELDLNRGLNQLKPTFKEWRLPSAQYRLTDDQLDTTTYTHTRNLKFYIQENQRMVEKNAQFAITVKRKIADEDIANTILITIVHDKKTILDEELSIDQQTMSKIKRLPKKTLWRSDLFDYQLDLYTAKGSIDISILGVFN